MTYSLVDMFGVYEGDRLDDLIQEAKKDVIDTMEVVEFEVQQLVVIGTVKIDGDGMVIKDYKIVE